MKEIKVSTVSQYVEHIEKLSEYGAYWYRGVAKVSYLPVPGVIWQNSTKLESTLEHHFLVGYKSYLESHSFSSWEVLALMQHHGLPTRLLDWTESALVALYFALSNEPSSTAYRAVWIMDPYSLNEATIGSRKLYCPAVLKDKNIKVDSGLLDLDSYLSPNLKPAKVGGVPDKPIAIHATQHLKRISSQKGCFTVHGTEIKSIDSYLASDDDFHMLKIDARSKVARNKMLGSLASMGIDEEFIYQDLDSLCRKIKRVHIEG